MMNVPFENVHIGSTSLRNHYEDVAADMFRSIMRWKFMIAGFVLGAIVLAALLVSVLPRTYTAQALIYPNMSSTENRNPSLSATINATAFVSSEVRRIGSQENTIGVVRRLKLDTNPAFISEPSGFDILRKLKTMVMPETVHATKLARAVARLRSRLQIESQGRTYVIAVRYTANSPEFAAAVVNAVLFEYLHAKEKDRRTREVHAAENELLQLSTLYGKRHPRLAQAEAKLASAKRKLQLAVDNPYSYQSDWFVLAEPNDTPSGPAGKSILGIASILGLVVGTCAAILLGRRDNGFKTSDEVSAHTSTHCIGLVPPILGHENPASAAQLPSVSEALRAVAIAAGLDASKALNKVVMFTTIDRPESAVRFTEALGRVLVRGGQRVLFVDASPRNARTNSADALCDGAVTLNDVLADEERARTFFEASGNNEIAVLKTARKSETGDDDFFAIRSGPLSKFIAAARQHYNVVLIASPLMLCPADTALIGRESDVRLFVVRWSSTSRKAVNSVIKRLRNYGVEVNGVVLTDVKYLRRGSIVNV